MEIERKLKLREMAHVISELFRSEQDKLPYGANIIDELHAGENAHSRILRMLLQYSGGGKYPVYQSFINLIKKNSNDSIPDDIDCYNPIFVNEEGRIDLLIKEYSCPQKFAIIVENKVCGATDQYQQIQRYIEKAESDNVDVSRIFVIYLTKDGTKDISDYSLTEKARKKLGITEENSGRFIRLDYVNHILPWLQNDVYPIMPIKEDILISSIRLYIDYLNGICGKREGEKQIYNMIETKMKEELNIKTVEDFVQLYKDVDEFYKDVSNMMIKEAGEILDVHLFNPLEVFLKEQYTDIDFTITDKGNDILHFWFDILISKWNKTKIRFTYDGSGSYYGVCHKDINQAKVDTVVIEKLKESFPGGKSTIWWPWYQMLKLKFVASDSTDIWMSVSEETLYNSVKEWLVNILERTEFLDM